MPGIGKKAINKFFTLKKRLFNQVTGPGGPKDKVGQPCIFPFSYKGTLYHECTDRDDEGKPWCSTLVDYKDRHIGGKGNWGYCTCAEQQATTAPTATTPTAATKTTTARAQFTTAQTPRVTANTEASNVRVDSSHGQWLPRADSFECGFSLSGEFVQGGQGGFKRLAITTYENLQQYVIPVCLIPNPPSDVLEVVGWGRTNAYGNDVSRFYKNGYYESILQKLRLPSISTEECEKKFGLQLGPFYMCAGGEPGKDSCNGDSGGPLIGRYEPHGMMYLAGLVSFGTSRCGAGFPGVYTNVEHYLPWIKAHLEP